MSLFSKKDNQSKKTSIPFKKSVWNKLFWRVLVPISVLVVGGLILQQVAFTEIHNVSSYNQVGGITAHTINLDLLRRQLTEDGKKELDEILKPYKGKIIEISYTGGNEEAFSFALEIKEYLESKKWEIDGVNAKWMPEVKRGVHIRPVDNSIEIHVGLR